MEGARHPGHMNPGPTVPGNRLSGRCPDQAVCSLTIACSQWCWRLEPTEIAELLRAQAALAGGRKVT